MTGPAAITTQLNRMFRAVPQTISDAQWTRFCDGAAVAFARQADIGDAWQASADAFAANAGSN